MMMIDIDTDTQRRTEADRQTDRQTDRLREMDRQTDRQDRQTGQDRQTDRQRDRQTGRQADRQTDIHTLHTLHTSHTLHTYIHTYIHTYTHDIHIYVCKNYARASRHLPIYANIHIARERKRCIHLATNTPKRFIVYLHACPSTYVPIYQITPKPKPTATSIAVERRLHVWIPRMIADEMRRRRAFNLTNVWGCAKEAQGESLRGGQYGTNRGNPMRAAGWA